MHNIVNHYYITQAKDSKQALKITCTLDGGPDNVRILSVLSAIYITSSGECMRNNIIIIIMLVLCS